MADYPLECLTSSPLDTCSAGPVTALPFRAFFLLRRRRPIPINLLETYLMKTTTVGHWDAPATTRITGALQSPRGGKLNNALRGTMLCLALGVGAASLPTFAEARVIVR